MARINIGILLIKQASCPLLALTGNTSTGSSTKYRRFWHPVFIPIKVGGRKALQNMDFELHDLYL
jgi:hypothetical protein